MKNPRILSMLLLVILNSCSEKSDVLPTPVASISFLANGTAFEWFEEEDPKSNNFMSMSIIQAFGGGRIHENRADGIFTARLTHVEDSSKVVITEGKF